MRDFAKKFVLFLIRTFGNKFKDRHTGRVLCHGWVWSWNNRIHGLLDCNAIELGMDFFPTPGKVRYKEFEMSFTLTGEMDVPSLLPPVDPAKPTRVLIVVLIHLVHKDTDAIMEFWKKALPENAEVLLAYGGKEEEFGHVEFEPKLYIDDPKLRIKNHMIDRQTHMGMYRQVGKWMEEQGERFTHAMLMEFDHWPAQTDFLDRMLAFMEAEKADVTAPYVHRVEHTLHPHWLSMKHDAEAANFPACISLREDKDVMLNSMVTGILFRKEAWQIVANSPEVIPVYVELDLANLAHHLGCRVRSWPEEQSKWVQPYPKTVDELKLAQKAGAWTFHPIKNVLEYETIFPGEVGK